MKSIIIVGGQDEIYENINLKEFNVISVQLENNIGINTAEYCAEVIPVSEFTVQEVERAARVAIDKYPISAMFGFAEFTILPAVEVAEKLNIPSLDKRISELCRIKPKLRTFLENSAFHLPFIEIRCLSEAQLFAEQYGYPLVVKDTMGAGSSNVSVCHDLDQLVHASQSLLSEFGVALLETYCGGHEYSVETLTLNGQHYVLGITEKFLIPGTVVEDSHIFPAPVCEKTKSQIERAAIELLSTLDHYHGPMHIEFKVDGDAVRLIEVNNRGGGDYIWEMVLTATGVNLIENTVRAFFDKSVKLQNYQPKSSLAYISLYKKLDIDLLKQPLSRLVDILRFQFDHDDFERSINNSTDRPGFCLLKRNLQQGHIADCIENINSIINKNTF
ncbi:ATP-grasp domain-containing protein [Vibrio antiquarius]|uniref:ATP-grasp domain-containing protein n=1 Tax=Vibrio antiquarius (strain Ex25) TaxID=150340 RepID=UPI0026583F6D|nr:ATP-grasp domain-containing protein [Vibrio antiquarius]